MVTLSATGGPATAALPIIAPQLQADGAAVPEVQACHLPTAAAQQPSHAASAPPMQAAGRALDRSAGVAAAEEALGRLSLSDRPKGALQAPSQDSSTQAAPVSRGVDEPHTAQAVSSEPGLANTQQQQQQQPGNSSTSINDPLRSPSRPFSQPNSSNDLHDEPNAASKQQVPQQAPQAPAQVRLLLSAHSKALPPGIACPTPHIYCLTMSGSFAGNGNLCSGQWTAGPKLRQCKQRLEQPDCLRMQHW